LVAMRTMGFWSRSLSGVLGLWFGLVMAAPAILHACPQSLAAASAADAPVSHVHGGHHSGSQHGPAPAECRCLGTCAVSAPASLAPAASIPAAIVTALLQAAILSTSEVPFDSILEHARPFATAPPARFA
jgi:hypothetical protein